MDVQLLIGGCDEPATGKAFFERTDPVTRQVATRAAAATAEDARRAVT